MEPSQLLSQLLAVAGRLTRTDRTRMLGQLGAKPDKWLGQTKRLRALLRQADDAAYTQLATGLRVVTDNWPGEAHAYRLTAPLLYGCLAVYLKAIRSMDTEPKLREACDLLERPLLAVLSSAELIRLGIIEPGQSEDKCPA